MRNFLELTSKECEAMEAVMKEKGFKYHADFIRECVNTYAGKTILPRRQLYKVVEETEEEPSYDGWDFAGGVVILNYSKKELKAYFKNAPDTETRLNLRMLHFVPKEECVWMRILDKHTIPKVRALLKPI